MKKFTLLLFMLAIAGLSYAQVQVQGIPTPVKEEPVEDSQIIIPQKGGGDVFWSETFDWGVGNDSVSYDLPDGWIVVDNADMGNYWHWRSPLNRMGGCCTNQGASSAFLTPDDGFIAVAADEGNNRDGVDVATAVDTYIMTPSIDCSQQSSVVVKFKQQFRTCCAGNPTMSMLVTNDDGVHWAEYSCRFGLSNNRVTDERYRHVEFNISDVAAGMSNVQIQFYWTGSTHYYWIIDDLSLSEAYENEVVLEDYWADINMGYDARVGHINYMPLTQMGLVNETTLGGNIGDYEFRGAVLNNGMADQWNLQLQMTINKNGEQVFQDVSDPIELWSLDRDTLTSNSAFLADDYGDYSLNFAAISENEEEVPENDTEQLMFTVTDSLYHRADFHAEGGANTGGWVGGANAGDMVGVWYDLIAPTEINSITAYINGVTDSQFPEFQYVLLKDIPDEGRVEWLLSDIYPADSTMEGTWVTLNMEKDGETEFLEPGDYIACVRFWGDDGTEEGSNGMSIGWDKDNRADGYTMMYQFVSDAYYSTGKMQMIGLVFNEKGGPTEAAVTFNVDMNAHIASGEFNPGSDFVDVAGTFNGWDGSEPLTDEDGDGIYTITLEGFTVASEIEYKYRINANWDTSEFPDGGPNRTYTIRYWNNIENVYNNGETTGVESLGLIESMNVYPNPTTGEFTVQISNTEISDMQISLMDIQGHVVYNNHVSGALTHTEVISEDLTKGVYFLSINNGKEIKVQKVIVR